MPTIRPRVVADNVYESQTSYTIDIDLPTKGILSTLWLLCRAKTETDGSFMSAYMRNLISSVSVNQAGQDALNAARPNHFAADYFYKTGKMPRMGMRYMGVAGSIEEMIPILFGDNERDMEHTVDLGELSDPQISVTYDLAGVDREGLSIWDEDVYPTFTVIADLIEGAGIPASKGYQSLRQVETYNPANSEIHLHELKGSRPIKTIYIQGDNTSFDYRMDQYIDEITIHGDNEAYVPFRMKFERYKEYIRALYGNCKVAVEIRHIANFRPTDGIVEERLMTRYELKNTTDRMAWCHGGSGRNFMTYLVEVDDGTRPAAGTNEWGYYHAEGLAPWSVYPIEMKKLLNLDYLDPTLHAPVYLELDHTSGADTYVDDVRVNIEDLVS